MINFRYHVVSVIGIFVALAVGIVLGAGPLQARINSAMGPGEQSQAASEQAAELSAQAGAEAAGLKELASASHWPASPWWCSPCRGRAART